MATVVTAAEAVTVSVPAALAFSLSAFDQAMPLAAQSLDEVAVEIVAEESSAV